CPKTRGAMTFSMSRRRATRPHRLAAMARTAKKAAPASRPILSARTRIGTAARAGFTLLEILLVLAIAGMTLALALPSLRTSLSQNAIQTTFYDFQRQAARLRAFAYNEGQAILLVDTGQFAEDPEAEVRLAEIRFQE